MQKQLNKLKQHLRICKFIILVLICFIILQAMPQTNEVEILQSDIELSNDLKLEALKLHQLEEYKIKEEQKKCQSLNY